MKSIQLCENRLRCYHEIILWEDQKSATEQYLFRSKNWYEKEINTYTNRSDALKLRYRQLIDKMKGL